MGNRETFYLNFLWTHKDGSKSRPEDAHNKEKGVKSSDFMVWFCSALVFVIWF